MKLSWLWMAVGLTCLWANGTEHRIVLHDDTGRGFPPDLVEYRLEGLSQANVANLRLLDEQQQAVPFQLRQGEDGVARLCFVTDLPADGQRTFLLRDSGVGPTAAGTTGIKVAQTPQGLVLSNGQFSLRMPKAGTESFALGRPASQLPAPVLACRAGDGDWFAASRILAERAVKTFTVELVTAGDVYAEAVYRLEWLDGGYYEARIRVVDQAPLAEIRESFDAGTLDGFDFWELELTRGWSPTMYSSARTNGNGALNRGWRKPLADLRQKPLWYLVPDSAWGTPLSHLGLYKGDEQSPVAAPLIGWIPLHKGDWRRMNAVSVVCAGDTVSLRFPMSVRHAAWIREVTSETSPFSMQEHEPGLPATYGRRVWGLMLALPPVTITAEPGEVDAFYQARLLYGVIGLDRYKDYQLDWPKRQVARPFVFQPPMPLAERQALLDQSALTDAVKTQLRKQFYSFGGDAFDSKKQLDWLLGRLRWMSGVPFRSPTMGHHYIAENYTIAAAADDLLAWPGLPDEARAEIYRRLALICHTYHEPDAYSYGAGSHSGNPNMNTARFASANPFVALIPGHPMAPRWQQHLQAYTEYKTGSQMAPGGGYFEFGAAYHMHGGSRVSASLPGLEAFGADNLARLHDYWAQDWQYYMDLLTPEDSRYGSRMIPGMANSPPGNSGQFLDAARSLQPHDHELAANLFWAWLANGASPNAANLFAAPVGLTPKVPVLGSVYYPGVGIVFRAHQGPQETWMLLRSGFNWSHWYIDQGHFLLYSRGASLAPFQPYQYWSGKDPSFDLYNSMRFGATANQMPHGWPDSNILDYAFGPKADYAWHVTGYPDWYIDPGASAAFREPNDAPVAQGQQRPLDPAYRQQQGAFDWHRQVMFLKGDTADEPNYFVFRDSTTGDGQLASWLTLNLLGGQEAVSVQGETLRVTTPWPVGVDYRFVGATALAPAMHTEDQPLALHDSNLVARLRDADVSAWLVDQEGQPLNKLGVRGKQALERHTIVRLAAAPGAERFWLAWPRTAEEAPPEVTRLMPGVVRLRHRAGTDYVILSPTPVTVAVDGVEFAGQAGTVRLRDGQVTLALCSGTGHIGWQGTRLVGTAPFERTLGAAELKPGQTVVTPHANTIAWPTGNAAGDQPLLQATTTNGERRYLLQSPTPVTVQRDEVTIEALRAEVTIAGDTVRIVVPDAVYAKVTVGAVGVRGLGPFDLTFAPDSVTGTVDGRRRSLVCTWPEKIVRPMFHLDDRRWYAGWADDHSIAKGQPTPQFAIAFGVLDGPHQVAVREWSYPALPPAPPVATFRVK